MPQSSAHELHDSLGSHVPSPHVLHKPQSIEHDVQSSFAAHVPSPHPGGRPPSSPPLPSIAPPSGPSTNSLPDEPKSSGVREPQATSATTAIAIANVA
jgi:hypothetical protein